MSVSDLQKMGLLKPESDWDGKSSGSSVPPVPTLLLGVAGIGGCVLLALGDGHALSWIGLLVFVLAMTCFVWLNIASVNRTLQASDKEEAPTIGESDGS